MSVCGESLLETITVAPIQAEMEDKYWSTWNANTRKCETNTVGPVQMQEMQFRVVWRKPAFALWPLPATHCTFPFLQLTMYIPKKTICLCLWPTELYPSIWCIQSWSNFWTPWFLFTNTLQKLQFLEELHCRANIWSFLSLNSSAQWISWELYLFFRLNCATLKAVKTFVIDQWEQSDRWEM